MSCQLFENEVEELTNVIVSASASIYIPTSRELLALSAMEDPEKARGECWSVSKAVSSLFTGATGKVTHIGIRNAYKAHYATLVAYDQREVVVDFTASQFSREAPFPLIADKEAWKVWVTHMMACGETFWVSG